MRNNPKLETCWIGPFQVVSKHSSVTYRLNLSPGSGMHPIVYIEWLQPYYASDALATAPDFKEDSVDYADFSEYQIPDKILEKKLHDKVLGTW